MFPRIDLFSIGDTDLFLPTYGLLFAAGVIISWLWFMRRAQELNVVQEKVFNITFYSVLAGLLGAKLALIVVDYRFYLDNPRELFGTIRSAGVLMGGLIAAVVVFIWYATRNRLPLRRLGDAVAAPMALAQAIGRLGCFMAGCCYGVPADPGNPFGMVFSPISAAGGEIARVPTQLIQAANDFVIAIILTVLWRIRIRPPGSVFWIYVLLYSLSRAIIELWRGDDYRGLYFDGAVSTSQLISAATFTLAAAMLAWGWLRDREAAK
jgi:phosphatidylglycerol:prolipoprotein diacylglycerol transferase